MKAPRVLLARLLSRRLRGILIRRTLAWSALTILVLSLGMGLCLILKPPKIAYEALLLLALSSLPVFLLWPVADEEFRKALRKADKDSVLEAWIESGPGPAQPLLERRARDRLEALELDPRGDGTSLRGSLKGLGRLFLASGLALLILQAGALFFMRKPVIVYRGPPPRAGSGQRMDEVELGGRLSRDAAGSRTEGQEPEAKEAAARPAPSPASPTGAGRSKRGEREDLGFEGLKPSELGAAGGEGDSGAPSAEEGGKGQEGGEKPLGEAGAAAAEEAGSERAPRGERGLSRSATGFEDSGDTGVASPLLDYKARMFEVLTDRSRGQSRASGELSLGELTEFERRYFDSFTLSAGLGPVEDAYASLLKRRWRELLEGRK